MQRLRNQIRSVIIAPLFAHAKQPRAAKILPAKDEAERSLILGAWGRGAFSIDPKMMGNLFAEVLATVFKEVGGAILVWPLSSLLRFISPFQCSCPMTGIIQKASGRLCNTLQWL